MAAVPFARTATSDLFCQCPSDFERGADQQFSGEDLHHSTRDVRPSAGPRRASGSNYDRASAEQSIETARGNGEEDEYAREHGIDARDDREAESGQRDDGEAEHAESEVELQDL